MIIFTLSMPHRGSWNNKWSGDGRIYARKRHNKAVPSDVVGKDFYYTWPDGWTACVSVEKVNAKEVDKIMKKSVGFYGYDWMIDSIIKNKEIKI